jgi:hypothetical protein
MAITDATVVTDATEVTNNFIVIDATAITDAFTVTDANVIILLYRNLVSRTKMYFLNIVKRLTQ